MKRGITKLTGKQMKIALDAVKTNSYADQILFNRLKPKELSDTPVTIQFDEEQADIILDSLPTPNKNENPDLTSLRKVIQQFIAKLRFE